MFNVGKGNKEKLKQNMDEIKNLVTKKQEEAEKKAENLEEKLQFDSEEPEQSIEDRNIKDKGIEDVMNKEGREDVQNPPIQNQGNLNNQNSQGPEMNNQKNVREDSGIQNKGNPAKKEIEELDQQFEQMKEEITEKSDKEDGKENRKRNRGNDLETDDIEEKTVQTSKSENPIFLDLESFEGVKHMIQEMHYLTSEIGDVIEHLEVGIEEDQDTETEAKEIISEFKTRRRKIEQEIEQNQEK